MSWSFAALDTTLGWAVRAEKENNSYKAGRDKPEAETRGVPERLCKEEQAKSTMVEDLRNIWPLGHPTKARKRNRAPQHLRRQISCEMTSSSQAA